MIGATVTPQRQQYAHFSQPYRNESMSVFYLQQSHSLSTAAVLTQQINNARLIAINEAGWYGKIIESYRASRQGRKFIHIPNIKNRIIMLSKNRVQMMVEDHISGCNYFHQYAPELATKLRFINVNKVQVSFMFSKSLVNQTFIEQFNQKLQHLLEQGVYQRLVAQYTPFTACNPN